MDKPLKLWEVVKGCFDGGYVGGETFADSKGNEIYFNGNELEGIEKADIFEEYEYIPNF